MSGVGWRCSAVMLRSPVYTMIAAGRMATTIKTNGTSVSERDVIVKRLSQRLALALGKIIGWGKSKGGA